MLKHKRKAKSEKRKTIKNYSEAVNFLESLSNISTADEKRISRVLAKARLKWLRSFLHFLGNPEKKLKIIHIAGTSGKGSTASMLHNIFQAAGLKAGSYTSPHTTAFCERIKVGDKYISEKELVELTNFLKGKMDEFVPKFKSINFFEASFILALLYFQKQHCGYAVIEAGLGGRYDSTNAIQNPIYTIITNIGRDHLNVIGPTLKDVAYEKAGIIKRGAPILTGESDRRWIKIFRKQAKLFHCFIVTLLDKKNLRNIKTNLDGTDFEYKNEKYKLKLSGEHQAQNAALAIECASDLKIPQTAVKKGLSQTFYPARLEVVSKHPLIIIDCAHNADKLQATLQFIQNFKVQSSKFKSYLILAAAKNKQIKKIVPELIKYFDNINFTRFLNPFRKCYSFSDWQKILFFRREKKIKYFHMAKDALFDILPRLRNNDLLLITGSIFLAGELRENWYPAEKIIKFRNSKF